MLPNLCKRNPAWRTRIRVLKLRLTPRRRPAWGSHHCSSWEAHAPPPELSIAHVGIILSCTASFAARDPYRCGIKKDFVKVRVTQYPTSFFPTHPLPKCLGAWNLPHLPLQRFGAYFASSPASPGTSGNSDPNATQRGLSSA